MGKIYNFILSISLYLILLPAMVPPVFSADPQKYCAIRTTEYNDDTKPLTVTDETRKARFVINVGNNKNYDSYKMEFRCGSPMKKKDATKWGDNEIYVDLDTEDLKDLTNYRPPGSTPCEFNKEPKDIWVMGKTGANQTELPVCKTFYDVTEGDDQCRLRLHAPDPTKGITPETDLAVSGYNLVKDGQFGLFVNGTLQSRSKTGPVGYLDTPIFLNFQLADRLPEGDYVIDIRRYSTPGNKGRCPLPFTVGPKDRPGGLKTPGKSLTSSLALGAGNPCTDPKKPENPGIKTAIGCIHTNPGDLIADVLKFGVGIGGGLAFLMMLLGAFQMLTSAGNPETLQAGKDRLTSAIIGLLVIIFSVLLLQIIGVDILGILKR